MNLLQKWLLLTAAALTAEGAYAVCAAEHIAGEYASTFGPISCRGSGNELRCCYDDINACRKKLELTLQPGAREVRGQWMEGGDRGGAKFAVDQNCNLVAGRWGTGSQLNQRWSVSGRTSPAAVAPPAPPPDHLVNFAGKSLYKGDNLEISRLVSNTHQPDGWCSALSFSVSAEFDRTADFVFDPEFLYHTLFRELLPALKRKHCPQAQQTITARVFLRDLFFNVRGKSTNRDAVEKEGRTGNASIATVSYYTDFKADPKSRPESREQLNITYNDNGVHRAHMNAAKVALLVGSADRLREYYERGGRTVQEYAVIQGKKAEIEALFQQVEDRYGVRPESYDVVRLLTGNSDQLSWDRSDEWYFLRSYIQTTTRLCGNKTVGEPYRSQSRFVNDRGQTVEESDTVLWYSLALRPKVKGRQIGSALFGVYKPDEQIASDVTRLVSTHGCGSEPLGRMERYFH